LRFLVQFLRIIGDRNVFPLAALVLRGMSQFPRHVSPWLVPADFSLIYFPRQPSFSAYTALN
jgi:hypothetical protein